MRMTSFQHLKIESWRSFQLEQQQTQDYFNHIQKMNEPTNNNKQTNIATNLNLQRRNQITTQQQHKRQHLMIFGPKAPMTPKGLIHHPQMYRDQQPYYTIVLLNTSYLANHEEAITMASASTRPWPWLQRLPCFDDMALPRKIPWKCIKKYMARLTRLKIGRSSEVPNLSAHAYAQKNSPTRIQLYYTFAPS